MPRAWQMPFLVLVLVLALDASVVDVAAEPVGRRPGGTPPPVQVSPFSLHSVSYGYPGLGTVVAKAAQDKARLPYPSPSGPKLSDDSTVVFSFKPHVPDAVLSGIDRTIMPGEPLCSAHVRGPCQNKFALTGADGDVGPTIDLSTMATRSSHSEEGYILEIRVPHLDLRQLLKTRSRYAIYLELNYDQKSYVAHPAALERGEAIGNYFERFIFPTFQSERCTTCHAMGDHDSIVHQHDLNGVGGYLSGPVDEVQPGSTVLCANCHRPPHVTDWRTPPFSFGINWKTMTSPQICNKVVSRLQGQSVLVETDQTRAQLRQNMRKHFHDDPRVKWAISDAFSAPPVSRQLERAKPGHWDAWLAIIDPWIELDQHCPVD